MRNCSKKNILITRPERFAAPLAEKLEAEGYAVWSEPLLAFEPLPMNKKPEGSFDAVLLTSRLALAALADRREEARFWLRVPCYVVGGQTAREARAFGFQDVREGGGDVEALFLKIKNEGRHYGNLLHIGGEALASGSLEKDETAAERVVHWPVYRMIPSVAFSSGLAERLKKGDLAAALFFSSRTASVYVDLAARSGLSLCGEGAIAIGLSQAVVEVARSLPWRRVCVAQAPTEESAVACLRRECPP